MKKHKKLITRSVLVLILISTLLGTFTIFSSAAGIYGDNLYEHNPIGLYFLASNIPNRGSAYWETPFLSSNDRIAFFAMGSSDGLWHIAPFVQGQQSTQSAISYYNNGFSNSDADMLLRSSLLGSGAFDYLISYDEDRSSPSKLDYHFTIRLDESKIPGNWATKPMYTIAIAFTDFNGNIVKYDDHGTYTHMSSFAEGLIKVNQDSTQLYPFIDCGVLFRQYDPFNSDIWGVRIIINEYFYPFDVPYPYDPIDYGKNLFKINRDGVYYDAHFKSYNINYNFGGFDRVYDIGFEQGKIEGHADGYKEGFRIGENTGYNNGVEDSSNYNAVNGIVSLAKVPSTFISSMLDFNIFEINLATTVKNIITMIVVFFIVSVLIKFVL